MKTLAVFVTVAFFVSGFFVFNSAQAVVSHVDLVSPDGGEVWRGSNAITWTALGESGDTVSILISANNFKTSATLVAGVPFDAGNFIWDTTGTADGSNYKIRVQAPSGDFDTSTEVFTVDNTLPGTTLQIDPATPDGDNGWYVTVPKITLSCEDNVSGCSGTFYNWDDGSDPDSFTQFTEPITPPGDGEHTLFFYSEDNAVDKEGKHNREGIQSFDVNVDTTPPEILSYTLNGEEADAFFNPNAPASVEIVLNASEPVKFNTIRIQDSSDTMVKSFTQIGSFETSATKTWDGKDSEDSVVPDGVYHLKPKVVDRAGNEADVVLVPHVIIVDTLAPTIDALSEPQADAVYKQGVAIPIVFTPSDPPPGTQLECGYVVNGGEPVGIAACESGIEFGDVVGEEDLTDGRNDVSAYVTDSAGNSTTSDPVSIVFDDNDTLTVGTVPAQDFASIQEAIDKATAGDTILVAAGTYEEDVNVHKSLHLIGDGFEETSTIVGQGEGEPGALVVSADNAIVEGFQVIGSGVSAIRISGARNNVTIQNNQAIAAAGKNALLTDGGQSNHTIADNIFEGAASQLVYVNGSASVGSSSTNVNFTGNTFAGTATGPALGQEASESVIAENVFTTETNWAALEIFGNNNTISLNTITNRGEGDGIRLFNIPASPILEAHILDNTIETGGDGVEVGGSVEGTVLEINGNDITAGGNGIYIGGVEDVIEYDTIVVSGNTLDGNGEFGLYVGGEDAVVEFETLTVTDNIVNSNGFSGIFVQTIGGVVFEGVQATVSGNTVTGNGEDGIHIYEIYNAEVGISGNVIDGNARAGVFVDEVVGGDGLVSSLTVSDNTISNNGGNGDNGDTGIHLNFVEEAQVVINQNSITGNGTGLFVGRQSEDEIEAALNWWGALSGPSHSSNPAGTGDSVTDFVDFSPWCTNEECTEFGSNGQLNALVLLFDPSTVVIPAASELTVTAVDVDGVILVNDTRQIELQGGGTTLFNGIAGIALPNLTNGKVTVDVTDTTPGTVNVVGKILGVPFGNAQVIFEGAAPTGIVLDDVVLPAFGQATDKYLEGWRYIFRVTVNDETETDLYMKFSDWVNTADEETMVSILNNTRLLLNAGAGVGITEADIESGFSLGNEYGEQAPGAIDISGVDTNPDKAGRQVQFDVFFKLPEGTVPGFYTTEFGILTLLSGDPLP